MRVIIITMSKRVAAGARADAGGDRLADRVSEEGWAVAERIVLPDDQPQCTDTLKYLCDRDAADVILTTGGTGLSAGDVTPEATAAVLERRLPGLEFAMFREGVTHTPYAVLSRAMAGTRGKTVILNLPGNPNGAVENLEAVIAVLPHAVRVLRGPQVKDAEHNPPTA